MVEFLAENALPLSEAAGLLPGNPSMQTLRRWWKTGIRGVRLETTLVGGRRFTTREALARFLAASNQHIPLKSDTPSR